MDAQKKAQVLARYRELESERTRKKKGGRWAETRLEYVMRLGRVTREQEDLEARYPWLLATVIE